MENIERKKPQSEKEREPTSNSIQIYELYFTIKARLVLGNIEIALQSFSVYGEKLWLLTISY